MNKYILTKEVKGEESRIDVTADRLFDSIKAVMKLIEQELTVKEPFHSKYVVRTFAWEDGQMVYEWEVELPKGPPVSLASLIVEPS